MHALIELLRYVNGEVSKHEQWTKAVQTDAGETRLIVFREVREHILLLMADSAAHDQALLGRAVLALEGLRGDLQRDLKRRSFRAYRAALLTYPPPDRFRTPAVDKEMTGAEVAKLVCAIEDEIFKEPEEELPL